MTLSSDVEALASMSAVVLVIKLLKSSMTPAASATLSLNSPTVIVETMYFEKLTSYHKPRFEVNFVSIFFKSAMNVRT